MTSPASHNRFNRTLIDAATTRPFLRALLDLKHVRAARKAPPEPTYAPEQAIVLAAA